MIEEICWNFRQCNKKYCVLLNAILFYLLNKRKSEAASYSLYATVEFNEQYEAFVRDHDDQREKGSEFTK